MAKPFDLSKFRKSLTKSIDGLGIGFNDPKTWVSTGCYALNYLVSGDFHKGIPLGKVTVFAGESGCLPETATVCVQLISKDTTTELTTISVGQLRQLWHNRNSVIKIDTPDGYQEITAWFDKGQLPLVRIKTASGLETRCATNHLVEHATNNWIAASEVVAGQSLITTNSAEDRVIEVELLSSEECYDFTVNHPNHRYWGDGFSSHNSGKSYICSGNIIKNAQEQGIFVVLIDSENALDEQWLHNLGVDTSEDKLLKLNMAMIDDVAKTISEFMKEYKAMPTDERPKVLFVIDSLGMLLTPTDTDQFQAGQMKGDLGRKPKALGALVRNCVNMFGEYEIGMVCTNHTYASQSMYDPDQIISGGASFIYASSIVVAMQKLKLKEDEDGNKTKEVNGIRSKCKIMKTRYNKPFEDMEVRIPWDTGMNPYSGMFDLLEKRGLVTREGNRYTYVDLAGNEHKYFQKEWNRNTNGIFDLVMSEFHEKVEKSSPVASESEESDEE